MPKKKPATTKPRTSKQPSPLKRTVWLALTSYRTVIRSMLTATIWPILLIALLRFFSDDQTGDQYSLVIGLISIFTTLVIARVALYGWDRRATKLGAFYSTVMSRYLAGVGASLLILLHSLPFLLGLILIGLVAVGETAAWVVVPGVALFLLGFYLLVCAGFSIFALMQDLTLTVWQAYRVAIRVSWRFWRPLSWRVFVGALILLVVTVALVYLGALLGNYTANGLAALVIDTIVSWLVTPLILFYLAVVFRRLVEAYE